MPVKPVKDWTCVCGIESYWAYDRCYNCGRPRFYRLTQRQARAVARELNKLGVENKGLSAMLAASTLSVGRLGRQCNNAIALFKAANRIVFRPYQKMPCGHERRFIAKEPAGTEWCVLCQVMSLRIRCRDLAEGIEGGKP